MANVERLRALRQTVKVNPENWDQTYWARKTTCGTTMCLAGWAAYLAGKEIDWPKSNNSTSAVNAEYLTTGETIEGFAREWLELDEYEAEDLFHSYTQLDAQTVLNELIEFYES